MRFISTLLVLATFGFNSLVLAAVPHAIEAKNQAAYSVAEQIYLETYNAVMENNDINGAFSDLRLKLKNTGTSIEDVMEAAQARGWISAAQLDAIYAAKANLSKHQMKKLKKKAAKGKLSQKEFKVALDAFGGKVEGAAYHGGYLYITPLGVIVLIVLFVLIFA